MEFHYRSGVRSQKAIFCLPKRQLCILIAFMVEKMYYLNIHNLSDNARIIPF